MRRKKPGGRLLPPASFELDVLCGAQTRGNSRFALLFRNCGVEKLIFATFVSTVDKKRKLLYHETASFLYI